MVCLDSPTHAIPPLNLSTLCLYGQRSRIFGSSENVRVVWCFGCAVGVRREGGWYSKILRQPPHQVLHNFQLDTSSLSYSSSFISTLKMGLYIRFLSSPPPFRKPPVFLGKWRKFMIHQHTPPWFPNLIV